MGKVLTQFCLVSAILCHGLPCLATWESIGLGSSTSPPEVKVESPEVFL